MFRIENYIQNLDSKYKYDTIICMSTTKWIHLNFGDFGIERFFLKIYNQLRDDGILILEP